AAATGEQDRGERGGGGSNGDSGRKSGHVSQSYGPATRRRPGRADHDRGVTVESRGSHDDHTVDDRPREHALAVTARETRHIFVTGGVASSLGKGLTASSLGNLLTARGLRVVMQKLDPYLNVDPGTMNPFQHGEVFVTDDGAETDLHVGRYARSLDRSLSAKANVTTGQIYSAVIAKERRGEYLGDTVQVIPHVTNEIKERIFAMAAPDEYGRVPDVVITEVGGTVGDMESLPFLEAIRQVRHEIGRDHVFYLHVSLVPYLAPSGELKTKPTQHSVAGLRNIGIQPDAIGCRSDREVPVHPGHAQPHAVSLLRRRPRGRGVGGRRPQHLRHPEGVAFRGARRVCGT